MDPNTVSQDSAFSHKKLINTELTDSQQMVPRQELWKVLVLMVDMGLGGVGVREKSNIHIWIQDQ